MQWDAVGGSRGCWDAAGYSGMQWEDVGLQQEDAGMQRENAVGMQQQLWGCSGMQCEDGDDAVECSVRMQGYGGTQQGAVGIWGTWQQG